jgi:signal peptidase I
MAKLSETKKRIIVKKVKTYLKRIGTDTDNKLKRHPLDKVGIYKLVGGDFGEKGDRYEMNPVYVQGRFIDAIAHAVQQDAFYGDWLGTGIRDVDNPHSGYVELLKTSPRKLNLDKDLVEKLNQEFSL